MTDKTYNSEEAKIWTREISDSLQNKLKGEQTWCYNFYTIDKLSPHHFRTAAGSLQVCSTGCPWGAERRGCEVFYVYGTCYSFGMIHLLMSAEWDAGVSGTRILTTMHRTYL